MDRAAARDAALVVGGRIGFVALWFLAVLLVYRGLGSDAAGLSQAGLFAVAIATVKIASGCIVDPGDVALMRRAPELLRRDPEAAYSLFRAAFLLRGGGYAGGCSHPADLGAGVQPRRPREPRSDNPDPLCRGCDDRRNADLGP